MSQRQICRDNRYVKVTDMAPPQISGTDVTKTDMLKWQICQSDRFVKMTDMSKWQICQSNRYLKVTEMSSWQKWQNDRSVSDRFVNMTDSNISSDIHKVTGYAKKPM